MQRGDAVGRVGEVDVHVRHVHAVAGVEDGNARVAAAGAGERVQAGRRMGTSCGATVPINSSGQVSSASARIVWLV